LRTACSHRENQFKVSITLITFIDAERQWSKIHLGISETEGPRAVSFCNNTIMEARVLCMPDAAEDDRFHDNPMVMGSPRIRFYTGAPVHTEDGQRIGTLCLADATSRILDADDLQIIRDIADCTEQKLTQTDRDAVYPARTDRRNPRYLAHRGRRTVLGRGRVRPGVTSQRSHPPYRRSRGCQGPNNGQRRDTRSRADQGGHAVNPDQPAVQRGSLHPQRRANHRQLQENRYGQRQIRAASPSE